MPFALGIWRLLLAPEVEFPEGGLVYQRYCQRGIDQTKIRLSKRRAYLRYSDVGLRCYSHQTFFAVL
jgi:hypothetical protein